MNFEPLLLTVGVQLIITILTWLIAGKVTAARLGERSASIGKQLSDLAGEFKAMRTDMHTMDGQIAQVKQDRIACQLSATKTFATREEFISALVEASSGHREVMQRLDALGHSLRESVSKVHGRVDGLAERVTRSEERIGAANG